MSMLEIELPLLQVALCVYQPLTAASEMEYPLLAWMFENVCVFESSGLLSSSSWKLVGESPPPAVKLKFWPSLGTASLTTTSAPRFLLTKVQVTVSPTETLIAVRGLPSSQVELDRSHPDGAAPWAIE